MSMTEAFTRNLQKLQKQIGYEFQNQALVNQALTHRSYSSKNNERFEFVGDSILNYSVAKMLFDVFPNLTEGELSRLRANQVNQDALAEIAQQLNLGSVLFLGEGELKSGGFRRPSILADALEALFAAVSFDSDFLRAEAVVRHLFKDRIQHIDLRDQWKDAKTLLQEALQARRFMLPKYRIEHQTGGAHEQIFTVQCDLGELAYITRGEGGSRRQAEQQAAKLALAYVEQTYPLNKKK